MSLNSALASLTAQYTDSENEDEHDSDGSTGSQVNYSQFHLLTAKAALLTK